MSDADSCHNCRITYYNKEKNILKQIRQMWDLIFDDPEEFADYYFEHVCAANRILLAYVGDEMVGMLHLNPYDICIGGKKSRCYYIVGVGVLQEYRRQGIMRKMMNQALADMKKEGCPFTFLMPKIEEYYQGFGFEKVYDTLELDIDISELEEMVPDDLSGEEGYYLKHLSRMEEESEHALAVLATQVNDALSKRYDVYAHRTASYLDAMEMEHRCQNGGVIAVYEDGKRLEDGMIEERLAGLFSYDVYDDTMYVERFESYDEHVRYVLDAAVRLAKASYCRRLVVTLAKKHFCDDIANVIGTSARMNDGHGIMAIGLNENHTTIMENLKERCFFDEIV